MASVFRQPFAPLDGSRLHSLTSLKNRQNALTPQSNTKRKAELLDFDDAENVDPCLSAAKRSKGASGTPIKDMLVKKPSAYILTKAVTTTPNAKAHHASDSPVRASTAPRRTLQPKSPLNKLNTNVTKSSPISAPAGRSPTHGKRSGLLTNHCRTASPYTRVDPPSFDLESAAPFSLDAALKGTLSGHGSRPRSSALSRPSSTMSAGPVAAEAGLGTDWFFEIHEDTPEEEMTNLLQHSTCVLDISSDEETEQKARLDKAEGRDKENIPPSGHTTQKLSARRAGRSGRAAALGDMVVERERIALGEMETSDFFATDCNETSVILVSEDYDEETAAPAAELGKHGETLKAIDQLMAKSEPPACAAVLQPIEGTGERFELWESGSAQDETEPAAAES